MSTPPPSEAPGGVSYTSDFYGSMSEAAGFAAAVAVPVILSAVRPNSVVDVGCGAGAWVRRFIDSGISDVVGVDGGWVREEELIIPSAQFLRADLTLPLAINRRFDLCVCLETAEHLPESRAAGLVADLTELSDVVLFSAAIPFQGGTHHVNERWQSYWVNLFSDRGYVGIDYLRRRIWHLNTYNTWYYAQNAIVFVRGAALERYPVLADEYRHQGGPPLSVVHPGLLLLLEPWEKHLTVRNYFRLLPRMVWRAVKALARRLSGRRGTTVPAPPGTSQWHPTMV